MFLLFALICRLKPRFDVINYLQQDVICFKVQSLNIKGKRFFVSYRLVPPVVTFPAALLAIQEGMLSCLARGTPPIYTALIRNSTVLVNTTNTTTIRLFKDGNYKCKAINRYGTDIKEVQVNFKSKKFFSGLISLFLSNIVQCFSQSHVNLQETPCNGPGPPSPCNAKNDELETITQSEVPCCPYCVSKICF